jgi:hypothetical protein
MLHMVWPAHYEILYGFTLITRLKDNFKTLGLFCGFLTRIFLTRLKPKPYKFVIKIRSRRGNGYCVLVTEVL